VVSQFESSREMLINEKDRDIYLYALELERSISGPLTMTKELSFLFHSEPEIFQQIATKEFKPLT